MIDQFTGSKSSHFSTNLDEVILITGAILMALPLPPYPVQILWINLLADSALDKTFPFMKNKEDVMNREPTKLHESFLKNIKNHYK